MAAAVRRCQRRRRSSLVVHIHVVSGEATRAALTLIRVLASVSQGSSQTVSSLLVLGMVIRRADTGCHTQQPLISVGDVTIVDS